MIVWWVCFQVLSLATQDSDNPDLRDRGFIYWRLLSTDPGAAKEVSLLSMSRLYSNMKNFVILVV